ncbi:MAG TPA: amidohydrolase [Bellilinea sp.]|nr:amidohydrolase [Bellilinea sp.]
MHPILARAHELKAKTIGWRRDLHTNPELGFQEVRTAGLVAAELERLGYSVTRGVGKTGVVGLLQGGKPGPCVLLRFDMDALPLQEESGAEYSSVNAGVMHACGHDGHVAIGLTAAALLTELQPTLNGTIKLVFQPAEEGLGGAAAMIQDGVLNEPTPLAALGLHLWNEHPVGWAAVTPGPFMAGADMFKVKITGKGGHGAMPHLTFDPVLAAAQVITALQSITARNVSPFESAVVSVTQIKAGTSFNIIPAEVELAGTVRTFKPEIHDLVQARMRNLVESVSLGMGCQGEIQFVEYTPPVVNAPEITRLVQQALQQVAPEIQVNSDELSSVSEDMALFLEKVPGCFFFIGSGVADATKRFGHHHPKFDIDEEVLPLAAAIITQAAINVMRATS